MRKYRPLLALGIASLLAAVLPSVAVAQSDVVRIVVPFAAGGALDVTARALADSLRLVTGRPYIVDNKPGASAIIGTTEVARAKPDGSVLLFMTGGHTTNAVLFKNLPYDSVRDFTPVTQVSGSPGFVLLVRARSPYKSVEELLQAARQKPGAISYGSAGVGNTTHLVGALFARAARIDMLHVPYKGSAMNDLLGGSIDAMFLGTTLARPYLQEGTVRALAISGKERVSDLPNTPSFAELGFSEADISAWTGLWGPAGMPPAVTKKLQEDVAKAVKRPEYIDRTRSLGLVEVSSTPAEFSAYVAAEIERYRKQLMPLGISMD